MQKLLKPIRCFGQVIPGEKIGRTINFPTANLALKKLPSIKSGVYLAVCQLKKNYYLGLAYYSPRRTFEVYLFDFNQDIYGRQLSVKLTHFLRPPKKVRGLLALTKLIQQDLVSLNDQVILVNKKDQILGIANKVQAHLGSGKLHRAISVQIFNSKKELLITQRSRNKRLWPLFWSNSCCSHPLIGESYLAAAERRTREELGLKVNLKLTQKNIYRFQYENIGREQELAHVFIGFTDKKPKTNKKEISNWQYAGINSLPDKLTPWFKLILKKLPSSAIFKA